MRISQIEGQGITISPITVTAVFGNLTTVVAVLKLGSTVRPEFNKVILKLNSTDLLA